MGVTKQWGASSKTVRKQKIHTIRSRLRQRRLMLLTAFVENHLFIYFDGLQDVSDVGRARKQARTSGSPSSHVRLTARQPEQ